MPPELIADRYRVEREVGRGGMGSVWLCLDEKLGRKVAAKQVGGLPGESSLHLARALREARHSAALNHPNVVAIYDALEDGDQVWLVMEYVPSRTLDQMVREEGPLDPRLVARVCADVADGLAAAHALGTVHRDVKPSNILVRDDDGRGLIADFGIARTVGQEQLTRSGLVTGTPAYFAPELARGHEPSPASDVWALGISLFVGVEGGSPYDEQVNAIALLNTIANQPPPTASRAGPLAPVMEHVLDPDPETRWSMARTAQALRAVATERPRQPAEQRTTRLPVPDTVPRPVVRQTPVDPPPAVPPPVDPPPATQPPADPSAAGGRRRALLALVALVAVALVAAGGWWLTRDPGTGTGTDSPSAGDRGPTRQPSGRPSGRGSGGPSSGATAGATSGATAEDGTEEPSPTPDETSSAADPSGTTQAPEASDAGSPADLVADYYQLLPEDTDAAWALLSPDLQDSIGERTFKGFWATIDDVRVGEATEVRDGVVRVSLTYTTDGRSEQETRELAVETLDDGLLISEDRGAV